MGANGNLVCDALTHSFLQLLPSTNTYSIANFHTQMGTAAARNGCLSRPPLCSSSCAGITICYCMPIMGDFLQSLESGAVQAIRISDDYSEWTKQWFIGRASIIGTFSVLVCLMHVFSMGAWSCADERHVLERGGAPRFAVRQFQRIQS